MSGSDVPTALALGADRHGGRSLIEVIESDPRLRLRLAWWSSGGPRPRLEPGQGVTGVVWLSQLAGEAEAGDSVLHGRLLGALGDPDQRFADALVGPLVEAFVISLDTHGIALYGQDGGQVGFEADALGAATGRVVVAGELSAGTASAGAGLDACLRALVLSSPGGARAARGIVDSVLASRMRFLGVTARRALADSPFDRFLHHVAPEQDEQLRAVLRSVREKAQARSRDGRLPRPVVVIDLDASGLCVHTRARRAAAVVGTDHDVPELTAAEKSGVLPLDDRAVWANFVRANALTERYPQLDWEELRLEFAAHFWRPYEWLLTDHAAPGLARFTAAVHAADGLVLYNTGRGDRHRSYTERVMRREGLFGVLLTQPDERRGDPTPPLKVERLRELDDVDVVAVIDDMAANREAIVEAFPGAVPIAVEHPGFATERPPGAATSDGAGVIASFERLPRPDGTKSAVSLSYARSMNEFSVGDLALPPWAGVKCHAVHLDDQDSRRLVSRWTEQAEAGALRAAERARKRWERDRRPGEDGVMAACRLIWHLVVDKSFLRGSRNNISQEEAASQLASFISAGRPVEFGIIGFPIKFAGLKARGGEPDLAEMAALLTLRRLAWAVERVYPPGARITILTDGTHFRDRPRPVVDAYLERLGAYREEVDAEGSITIVDIDRRATEALGPELPELRREHLARHRSELVGRLRGLDVTADPVAALMAAPARNPAEPQMPSFREFFTSIVHSVPVQVPGGGDPLLYLQRVYADLYQVDPSVITDTDVRCSRAEILSAAWDATISTLAAHRADASLGYAELNTELVKLRSPALRRGSFGISYLGGAGVVPWHVTGAVTHKGEVSGDFLVWLAQAGFVPVYSGQGPTGDQPWFMVPSTMASGGEIDRDFFDSLTMRSS